MRSHNITRMFSAALMAAILAASPLLAFAQTTIKMPKNKYKVQDDVEIGRKVSGEVEQQFPLLRDRQTEQYVQNVGRRLVAAIPRQFQQPAFDYSFKVVNASDINAFALPGGPMFVNRGMIEASRNEGEMAGVMAHEISHVALRHATAQQTKINSPLNQILGIGAVLGGAVVGGQAGAQAGQLFATGYFLRYSRAYESQADILGARIMADAGYDPHDLANMFQTIAQQGGGRNPEWLSSHPDPGNRYQKINREADSLQISRNPIKITREFERIQSRLRGMPPAKSMSQIGQQGKQESPTAGGSYSGSVQRPSTRTRVYSGGNWLRINVPDNWREFGGQTEVTFAPDGAFGDQGITHGAMLGVYRGSGSDLSQNSRDFVSSMLRGNSHLRQQSNFQNTRFAGRSGLSTVLSGRSPIYGQTELVTIFTTQLRNGETFYFLAVSPETESSFYNGAFRNMINSIRLNDSSLR